MTVIPTIHFQALCAEVAAIEATDIDDDLVALIGR